jgi:spore coat protein D
LRNEYQKPIMGKAQKPVMGQQQMPSYPSANCGYPQVMPAQQKPTQTAPAQYSPMKQNTQFTGQDVIVPMVHPSHTTHVNQTNFKYMHSYPHTQSVVNQATHKHFCVDQQPIQNHCIPRPPCKPKWC